MTNKERLACLESELRKQMEWYRICTLKGSTLTYTTADASKEAYLNREISKTRELINKENTKKCKQKK